MDSSTSEKNERRKQKLREYARLKRANMNEEERKKYRIYVNENARKNYIRVRPILTPEQKIERANNQREARLEYINKRNNVEGNTYPRLKKYLLRTKYNCTSEQLQKRLISQDNKCAICKTELTSYSNAYSHIDHNHITGEVRGILCSNCNLGIGHLREDISILKSAINYLQK